MKVTIYIDNNKLVYFALIWVCILAFFAIMGYWVGYLDGVEKANSLINTTKTQFIYNFSLI